MERAASAPGFYGKLPSYGDFVGRRLPAALRDRLDDWLQRGLLDSRAALGPAWAATWGSSPLWRFALGAGVCGEEAWAGVMMPSADRVGRCFPLLLAAAIDGTPSLDDCLARYDGWYSRLEALALTALDDGFMMDAFDAGLLVLDGAPPGAAHAGAAMPVRTPLAAVASSDRGALRGLACEFGPGRSAWWCDGSPLVKPCLAVCAGLPGPLAFGALLDGRWTERGWDARARSPAHPSARATPTGDEHAI